MVGRFRAAWFPRRGKALTLGLAVLFTFASQGAPPVGTAAATPKGQMPTPGTPPGVVPPHPARPNILFILLDDMREDGVMNVPEVLPKTKQWLAQAGTTFTQGFVTTSLCCPERATIWSGRISHNNHVYDNYTGDGLDRDWITPRYLHDAGYHTALVGKFITDWNFRYEPPHFDDYAAFQGGYTNAKFWVKDPGATSHHAESAPYSTDYIADKATQYINAYQARPDQPWFMQVSPHAPHNNLVEGKADSCNLRALYTWPARHDNTPIPAWNPTPAVTVEAGPNAKAEKMDKVPYLRGKDFTQKCGAITHEGHMRTLLAADEMVDKIMTTLQTDGKLANTLVLFTSDNGWSWDERGATSKALPYNEDMKVPLLVRWDGVFPAGAVDPRPVSGEDYLPTYLRAAGYTPPEVRYPFDGKSFLPGEAGRDTKYLEFGPVGRPSPKAYQGHLGIPTWASMRTPTWQYIEYYEADNKTVQFREYYDLNADPWEINNLLADNDPANDPDATALSTRLHQLWTCTGTTGANPCP
jgi:arylsulfatase A-like enzyme